MRLSTSGPENSARPSWARTNVGPSVGHIASSIPSGVSSASFKTSRWSCGKYPTRTSCPHFTRPASAASRSTTIRSSVDLPRPFGPMMATRSPRRTVSETSVKTTLSP